MYDARKHICFNLGRVMRRVYDYYEQRLSPFGITPPQYFAFNALRKPAWSISASTLKNSILSATAVPATASPSRHSSVSQNLRRLYYAGLGHLLTRNCVLLMKSASIAVRQMR